MFLKLMNVCLIFKKVTRMTSFQTFIKHQL